MGKSVSFRIRREYFDQIVRGEKKVEFRASTAYWCKRFYQDQRPDIAVFICGREIHRRRITAIHTVSEYEVMKILGRKPSAQGMEDLRFSGMGDSHPFAIYLGKVIG